jgi:hypothetical protein
MKLLHTSAFLCLFLGEIYDAKKASKKSFKCFFLNKLIKILSQDLLITVNRLNCSDINAEFVTDVQCILKLKSRTKRLITVIGVIAQKFAFNLGDS